MCAAKCNSVRVMVRADASEALGGGHVMRCLTLADALASGGASCIFACADLPPSFEQRVRAGGHAVARVISPLTGADLAEAGPARIEKQQQDCDICLDAAGAADWIVLDHYGLDVVWERRARAWAPNILVFDDLANRAHQCEILLDQTYGRRTDAYRPLVPASCRILAGPTYAPLRPEFAALREETLGRRSAAPARRLLITLGSTDFGGITARVLAEALEAPTDLDIDVVIGGGASSLGACRALAQAHPYRVRLHIDSNDMAMLMARADLAIGAAGATSWERCCLGLPGLAIVLTENQRVIGEQLHQAGAHRLVLPGTLGPALADLAMDGAQLLDMSRRASQVTDGRGAERVREVMLGCKGAP